MKEQRFRTFSEFWPHFVRAHEKKATRVLHFAGTTAALACIAGGVVLRRPLLLALAPVAAYAPAWIGHFFIEKNRPIPADDPLWSIRADLQMWAMMLAGTMDAEVERVTSSRGSQDEHASVYRAVYSAIVEEQRARRARESLN